VLLAASYSFMDSHIVWPRGVVTMLAFAAGFTLIAIAATTPAATPLLRPRRGQPGNPDRTARVDLHGPVHHPGDGKPGGLAVVPASVAKRAGS